MDDDEFVIAPAAVLDVADDEISALLTQVYVAGGYTRPEEAHSLFDPAAVRARGEVICARQARGGRLAGMVIFVPPGSPAIRHAGSQEAEVHLLGVLPEYRGRGIGQRLVSAVISRAIGCECTRLVLWTQLSMEQAQRLYVSNGFTRIAEREWGGRRFLVYELSLAR